MTDLSLLKQLREETGVSVSLCKKALDECKGDLEKAKKLLLSWGAEKVASKASRATGQGALFSYVHHNKKIAALVELLCETDFVAANSDFQHLGNEIAMQIASTAPKTIDELTKQEYIRDPSKKIEDLLKEAVLKFGENTKIGKIYRMELGEK